MVREGKGSYKKGQMENISFTYQRMWLRIHVLIFQKVLSEFISKKVEKG